MDAATIRAVEASVYAAGYPTDAAAVLLIEVDGLAEGVEADAERVAALCAGAGAREVRVAADDAERARLWQGRKKAFGAMGRLSSHLVVQDAVVPRTRLPEVLARIHEIADGVRGDGLQRVPRRRRQPAPEHSVRRRRPAEMASGWSTRCRRSCAPASTPAAPSPANTAWGSTSCATCPSCSATTRWMRCAGCATCSIRTGGRTRARWCPCTAAANGMARRRTASAGQCGPDTTWHPATLARTADAGAAVGQPATRLRPHPRRRAAPGHPATASEPSRPHAPRRTGGEDMPMSATIRWCTGSATVTSFAAGGPRRRASSALPPRRTRRSCGTPSARPRARRTPLRLRGAGCWLDAGRPVSPRTVLDLSALRGIVEYVPGDLTMTARAGTPLAHLQAAARAEGQFVPLDPWGTDRGTLGATLATATAGPAGRRLRPAARRHPRRRGGHRHRGAGARRRPRGEERRRLRHHPPRGRQLGHARRHRRGVGAAARAARGRRHDRRRDAAVRRSPTIGCAAPARQRPGRAPRSW